jgi:hypothetical protein
MTASTYVILFERGSYKGIVGPYTPDVAKKTIRYWKRKRSLNRNAYTVVASSHDDAFRKTLGVKANPLDTTTRNVLLGVAALGALSVIAYAMSGSSATSTGGSAGSSAATGGSANFGPGIGPGGKIKPG